MSLYYTSLNFHLTTMCLFIHLFVLQKFVKPHIVFFITILLTNFKRFIYLLIFVEIYTF